MWHALITVSTLLFSLHTWSDDKPALTPLLKWHTPNSILLQKHLYKPMPVGDRTRYATCTSAAWFHGHYLALANLYGRHIHIYFFDEQTNTLHLIQEITDPTNTHLHMPEHMSVSPDETLLVLSDALKPAMHFYSITPDHRVSPWPLVSLPQKGLVHNVRFSPDGNYCACVCFDTNKAISIYTIDRTHQNSIRLHQTFCDSNYSKLRLKAIYFTQNGRFAILAYSLSIIDSTRMPHESLLAVRTFNQARGTLGDTICTVPGTFSIEDLCLSADEIQLLATNQAHDELLVYPFNPRTGIIDPHYVAHNNPDAQLSFPHGISISRDGNYLAVTSYGDDSCNIYALQNGNPDNSD